MSYDPRVVANYLIFLARSNNKKLTNLKLQKILYFVNAAYLLKTNGETPLLNGNFERWMYGPVMYNVYSAFRDSGASPITKPAGMYKFNEKNPFKYEFLPFDDKTIKKSDKEIIDKVFNSLIDYSPSALVSATHKESIWSDYKKAIDQYNAPKYGNNEIYEYFKSHPQDCIWKNEKN